MEVIAAGFACVWMAVAMYVGWLGRNQRRLTARLQALEAIGGETRAGGYTAARAA